MSEKHVLSRRKPATVCRLDAVLLRIPLFGENGIGVSMVAACEYRYLLPVRYEFLGAHLPHSIEVTYDFYDLYVSAMISNICTKCERNMFRQAHAAYVIRVCASVNRKIAYMWNILMILSSSEMIKKILRIIIIKIMLIMIKDRININFIVIMSMV